MFRAQRRKNEVLGLTMLLCGAATGTAEEPYEPYRPAGHRVVDIWFARDGDTYHAYYVQLPWPVDDPKDAFGQIGHATSKDLKLWTDHGISFHGTPGTWNDGSVATSSIARYNDKWWMAFNGVGTEQHGIGMAISDDLFQWKTIGDTYVFPLNHQNVVDVPKDRLGTGAWKSRSLKWYGVSDPYIYPEPLDGKFVMAITAKVHGDPIATSGCVSTLVSEDMKNWECGPILAYPKWLDRLEVPQIWTRDGRWYLYFGGTLDHGIPAHIPKQIQLHGIRANYVFTADRWDGPYEPRGNWMFDLPDRSRRDFTYIAKILNDPAGEDKMLIRINSGLSVPYPVSYPDVGGLKIEKPKDEE